MEFRSRLAGALSALVLLSVPACGNGTATGPAQPAEPVQEDEQLRSARLEMVERNIAGLIREERVLQAMREVPRHRFVPEGQIGRAYDNRALPIGFGPVSYTHLTLPTKRIV